MGILSIILIVVLSIIFFGTLFVGPKLTRLFLDKRFTISFGIIILVAFIVGKYIWYILDFINYKNNGILNNTLAANVDMDPKIIWSLLYSNLLLLNASDLFMLIISLCLIFCNSNAISKVFSTITITSVIPIAILTLLNDYDADTSFIKNIDVWRYLLIGNGITRLHFISYCLTIFAASGILVSAKQFSRWSILSSFVVFLICYLYLIIAIYAANVSINTSGFNLTDWNLIFGNLDNSDLLGYGIFFKINSVTSGSFTQLGSYSISFLRIVLMLFSFIIVGFIIFVKNILTFNVRKIITIYNPWYQNSKIFKSGFYYFDSIINNFLWLKSSRAFLYGLKGKNFNSDLLKLNQEQNLNKNINKDNLGALILTQTKYTENKGKKKLWRKGKSIATIQSANPIDNNQI